MLAGRQCGGGRKGTSHAVRPGHQAGASKPEDSEGSGEGTHSLSDQAAKVSMPAVVRDPKVVTYALLDQASRRKLAGRQHGEGSGRRNSRAVISNRRAIVSKRQRGEGSGNRSSQADTSTARRTLASRQRGV